MTVPTKSTPKSSHTPLGPSEDCLLESFMELPIDTGQIISNSIKEDFRNASSLSWDSQRDIRRNPQADAAAAFRESLATTETIQNMAIALLKAKFINSDTACGVITRLIYNAEGHFFLNEGDKGQNLLQLGEDLISKVPNTNRLKPQCLIKLASVYVKIGKNKEAVGFLKEASELTKTFFSMCYEFKEIALLHLELRNAEEAEEFLNRSKESIPSHSKPHSKSGILTDLSLMYIDLKKIDEATSLLIESEESLGTPESIGIFKEALSSIVFAYIRAANLKEAERVANLIFDANAKDSCKMSIFKAYMNARNVEEARRVASTIENSELKSQALK